MQDNDNGSGQQGSWQPPEYVSPWIAESGAASSEPGYQEPGYQPGPQPGYQSGPQPGYQGYTGNQGYPGYGAWGSGPGQPGSGHPGWGYQGYGAPPPPPPPGSRFGKVLAYVAVAVLAAGAGAGAAIALNHSATSSSAASGTNSGPGGTGSNPFSGSGGDPNGYSGSGSGSGSSSAMTSQQEQALENKVDPALVDITSQLKYDDATAQGTGMIISSSGLVLTNNHVIDDATSVSATLVESGRTYTARVVGYDSQDDVALLQLVGASGLHTVTLGNSSKVAVGQAVLGLGNAGGRGGTPSTAPGTVTGTGRTIEASDEGADTTETLHDMLQTDAPIQEGDSGGPLVNTSGQVVGMDTAANTGQSVGSQSTTGFAIPINNAVAIETAIAAGHASTTVHIGLGGFMGVSVADASKGCGAESGGSGSGGTGSGGTGSGSTAPVNSGALVCEVIPGTPALSSGLEPGDVITTVNGQTVTSSSSLTTITAGAHPGDQLAVGYVDASGARHTTSVTVIEIAK